jgi:hypothetical protein
MKRSGNHRAKACRARDRRIGRRDSVLGTKSKLAIFAILLLGSASPSLATTIDFEAFSDSTVLTNQIPGLNFANAIVLTAGLSLNELEFPPHSGNNVVGNTGGPITITFAAPETSVSGFFTYTTALTLRAFDPLNNLIATTVSAFSINDVSGGAPGSAPNEFLSVSGADIASVTLTENPAGGVFTLDDLSFSAAARAIPEPASIALFGAALTALGARRLRLRLRRTA